MKKTLFFLLTTISVFGQAKPEKVQVLILGTYHMGGGSGYTFRDILTTKKQKEVSVIIDQLKVFKADKIFVESSPESSEFWNNIFESYKKGIMPTDSTFYGNEIFQIGIKLANKLGLQKVYPVNYDPPIPEDSTSFKSIFDKEYSKYLKSLYVIAKTTKEDDWMSETLKKSFLELTPLYESTTTANLGQTILSYNSNRIRHLTAYTAAYSNMDNDPKGIGAELTNIQVFRNMKIFQNILNSIDKDTKRIFIVYGASHAQPLRDLFELNPMFEIVEVDKYIK